MKPKQNKRKCSSCREGWNWGIRWQALGTWECV